MVPWSNNDRDQVSNWKNLSVELCLELCWGLKTSHHTEKPDLSQTMFSITREENWKKKKVNISGKKPWLLILPKNLRGKVKVQTVDHVVKYKMTEKKLEKRNNPHLTQKDVIVFATEAISTWQFKIVY